MENETILNILTVLSYTFMWTTLYFLLCLRDPRKSYEWHCRMVTVVHAILISILAFYGTLVLGPWPWTEAGGPNTPHHVRTCSICLGYFLFDFTWCLYHKTEGPIMLTHHTLSIVGMTWSLLSGKYGTELVVTIAGAEITNPLLQLRWFMKEMGHYNTVWGDIVDAAFMFSFGFFRIYLGSILLYCYFQQPTDNLGRLGGVLIYTIGWAFFISIVQFAIYKYSKRYKEWTQSKSPRTNPTIPQKEVTMTTSSNGLHAESESGNSDEVIRKRRVANDVGNENAGPSQQGNNHYSREVILEDDLNDPDT